MLDTGKSPPPSPQEYNSRHPPAFPVVAQQAFTTMSDSLLPNTAAPAPQWNPSELGLVHLASIPSSRETSTNGSERSSLRPPQSTSGSKSETSSNASSGFSKYYTPEETSLGDDSKDSSGNSASKSSSDGNGRAQYSDEVSVRSQQSDAPRVSVRFQHMRDEHGHHVITGREGKLTRCEDEPIRTPGAVQGFGVLIVVEEVEDALVNSAELLGLPPRYLFKIECFTDVLPESQASLLWDNVQYLSEPPEPGDTTGDDELERGTPDIFLLSGYGAPGTRRWTCWCAIHRPQPSPYLSNTKPKTHKPLIVMEFELESDFFNPLYQAPTIASQSTSAPSGIESPDSIGSGSSGSLSSTSASDTHGLDGDHGWIPSTEDIFESTMTRSKPLQALERLRRLSQIPGPPKNDSSQSSSNPGGPSKGRRGFRRPDPTVRRPGHSATTSNGNGNVSMMDVFSVMAQINEQLGDAPDLDSFLKVTVGVIKDLTQFHRVLVYQFDEVWNGQVVAELVDWSMTHDLYKGLHFPAGDIPAQVCLFLTYKVRILYDRDQPTARIVVRNKEDLENPLNMTHCYLRAMSPIHIKYLGNMGVRASMSVSIMAFGSLWGLVACHSYGQHGMRVSFPVRQMLRLLSQSISRNIERLSYAQRLHTRKLTGYIVSNADDLLGLFDADFGILVIGDGAKILGPNQHGQEILIMAEYLRLKQFNTMQVSQAVTKDFPDLNLSTGLEVIAGLLYVPLSSGGKDFIALLRKGQPRDVRWAGKPYKADAGANAALEPRKSFKIWSETVAGRCRAWTDEQLETAGVLALVYGKFIEVWRQKENALQTTKLTNLLLSNASHEVRTPLNHIINYLEMALNGPLDFETRDNLNRSHTASKNLLFTINDLLDLTRLESGNETSLNEPFNLAENVQDAISIYRNEAYRRKIDFEVDVAQCPGIVIGDRKKIRTVVQNLTANALKYTIEGKIAVRCIPFGEPEGLRGPSSTAMEIVVADTGCGIPPLKLESIFREIEQVESSEPKTNAEPGVGLGLAVVARIVEQLGGQLRVESKVGEGSQFSFLLPLSLSVSEISDTASSRSRSNSSMGSSHVKATIEIDSIVEALGRSRLSVDSQRESPTRSIEEPHSSHKSLPGVFPVSDSQYPVRPIKVTQLDVEIPLESQISKPSLNLKSITSSTKHSSSGNSPPGLGKKVDPKTPRLPVTAGKQNLRILIVEDNDINRLLLAKRLRMDGHTVVNTTNGQEGLDKVISDRDFDCVLMDINMPILNGLEASERIRLHEKTVPPSSDNRRLSLALNGRIPIFAVSASLYEQQRSKLSDAGMDGWILKPIDFKRLATILKGVTDLEQRKAERYTPGCNWEFGGWLAIPSEQQSRMPSPLDNAANS
ncbi:hypothetical protein EV360DRAFT_96883 [Lentinula raphanica]|nr:hypothetical protein EV360DRAFT_96883 [Lentinula raphanica]